MSVTRTLAESSRALVRSSCVRLVQVPARTLSTSVPRSANAVVAPSLGTIQPQKRPVGGFRGGCVYSKTIFHIIHTDVLIVI